MSSMRMQQYIDTYRNDLEDEKVSEEIKEFLNRSEELISIADKNAVQFFNSFYALKKEVNHLQKNCEDMLNENKQLGWTFSSTRSNIEYDRKIQQLIKLNDVFEQVLTINEQALKTSNASDIIHENVDSEFTYGKR